MTENSQFLRVDGETYLPPAYLERRAVKIRQENQGKCFPVFGLLFFRKSRFYCAIKVSAAILCGGESRRMGQDKAKLQIGKIYILEQIVRNIMDNGRMKCFFQ